MSEYLTTLEPANILKIKVNNKKDIQKIRDKYNATENWIPVERSVPFLDVQFVQNNLDEEMKKAWLRRVITLARRDPNVFIELVLENTWDSEERGYFLRQAWFHRVMQDLFHNRKLQKVAIALPRGFGKTTQVIGAVLWALGNNQNLRIKLVAEGDNIALQRVYEIKTHIENNRWLHLIFPNLRKPQDKSKWGAGQFWVERELISRDPTLQAYGVLSSGTGGRADLLIGDDVVGRRNALTQSALRKEVKSAWNSVWTNQVLKKGKMWYIFTPWHKDDLSHDIVRRKGWKSFIVPVGKNFETPFPEYLSGEDLKRIYEDIGEPEFSRAFWLSASDDTDTPISNEYIHYFDPGDIETDNLFFLLSSDLAVGKENGDHFATVILAVNMDKKLVYVLDYLDGIYKLPGQVNILYDLIDKWGATYLVVESVNYQESLVYVLKADERYKKHPIKIYPFRPAQDKRLRMEAISPLLSNKNVLFNRSLSPNAYGGKGLLISQLIRFGIEPHDDVSDALVQGLLFLQNKLRLWSKERKGIGVRIIKTK